MHLKRTILVIFVAVIVSSSADELVHKRGPAPPNNNNGQGIQPRQQGPGQQGHVPPGPAPPGPRGPERQSRGFDFLAPLRGIFGGGRPRPAQGAAGGPSSAASHQHNSGKHYGVKPSASENNGKQPHQGQYYGGPQQSHHQHQQQQPQTDGFIQEGYRPGFPPSFADYAPFGDDYGQQGGVQGAQSSPGHSTHQGPPPPAYPQPPPHGKSQFGKRPPPPPPRGFPHPPHHGRGPHGPPKFGGPNPHGPPQTAQQFTYHTYAKPQMKHHHYHSFMNPEGQRFEAQPQNFYPTEQQPPASFDGPQPAQQHQVPSFSPPSSAGPNFGSPQDNSNGFAPNGFQEFAGFGPANNQAEGSQTNAAEFFGGPESYPEQYEDQTRNTREPQIHTADGYDSPPQGAPFPPRGFNDEYFPSSTSAPEGPGGIPSSSPRPFFPESSSTQETFNTQASGPIIKSHPLRSPGRGRPLGPPPSGPSSSSHPGSYDEESRREPFLYRPVSSSIQVPGAVDEDAVYGKPMMMDASTVTRKPLRLKKFKGNQQAQSSSKQRPVYMPYSSSAPPTVAPFKRPSQEIMPLDSPRDPHYMRSSPSQQVSVVDSDTAATGHHGGHGGHGLESSNGDRITYHVAGHEGPYSYRFGYDTGKGYNRMFRFEEKDGKGYVTGKYGFYDKHGKLNVVKYEAHPQHGYHAEREHGHHHQTHSIKH